MKLLKILLNRVQTVLNDISFWIILACTFILIMAGVYFMPRIPFSSELTHRLEAWHDALFDNLKYSRIHKRLFHEKSFYTRTN